MNTYYSNAGLQTKRSSKLFLIAGAALAAIILLAISFKTSALGSTTVYVTPSNPQGWAQADVKGDGSSVISSDRADNSGGLASLKQSFSSSAGKTNYTKFADFGNLADVSALSFDWYRDSSSTAPGHLTPAVGLYVSDATGQNVWLLKWEGVYNEYPVANGAVPTDQWITENIKSANFWRIPQYVNGSFVGFSGCNQTGDPYQCFVFDRKLNDSWLTGYKLVGIEVGIGSGWNGSYLSYVDNVTIGDTTYNFELTVPKPVAATSKDQCMNGNWKDGFQTSYKNQGACVSSVVANDNASFKREQ